MMVSISSSLMPTMASPRFSERRASRSASCQLAVACTDGGGTLGRVSGLEDAGTDEHTFGTQFHHERGIGRSGHATGGEVDDRQTTVVVHILGEIVRHGQLLGGLIHLVVAQGDELADLLVHGAHVAHGLDHVAGAGSPLVRIMEAPSEIRRSASPRFFAPHTNGTSNWFLSMWYTSSAGLSTSDSSM